MASKVAIAIMRDEALGRIQKLSVELATQLDLAPIQFPTQVRDVDMLATAQIQAIGDFVERVQEKLQSGEWEKVTLYETPDFAPASPVLAGKLEAIPLPEKTPAQKQTKKK